MLRGAAHWCLLSNFKKNKQRAHLRNSQSWRKAPVSTADGGCIAPRGPITRPGSRLRAVVSRSTPADGCVWRPEARREGGGRRGGLVSASLRLVGVVCSGTSQRCVCVCVCVLFLNSLAHRFLRHSHLSLLFGAQFLLTFHLSDPRSAISGVFSSYIYI